LRQRGGQRVRPPGPTPQWDEAWEPVLVSNVAPCKLQVWEGTGRPGAVPVRPRPGWLKESVFPRRRVVDRNACEEVLIPSKTTNHLSQFIGGFHRFFAIGTRVVFFRPRHCPCRPKKGTTPFSLTPFKLVTCTIYPFSFKNPSILRSCL